MIAKVQFRPKKRCRPGMRVVDGSQPKSCQDEVFASMHAARGGVRMVVEACCVKDPVDDVEGQFRDGGTAEVAGDGTGDVGTDDDLQFERAGRLGEVEGQHVGRASDPEEPAVEPRHFRRGDDDDFHVVGRDGPVGQGCQGGPAQGGACPQIARVAPEDVDASRGVEPGSGHRARAGAGSCSAG